MAKSQLVMISVIKDIHQVGVKGMDVVHFWEALDDAGQFLVYCLLHEFNFAHVELSDTLDLESS